MRIVLSCDVLRKDQGAGDAEINSAWLWHFVSPLLKELGHELILHTRAEPVTAEAIRAASRGLDPRCAWPLLYSDPAHIEAVRRTCHTALTADFVIGHELSPNQLRVFHSARVPVLDLRLDAVRFAADLFLRARTNDPTLASLLDDNAVSDAALTGEIDALRAQCSKDDSLPGPAVLFAGQTDLDASLIEGSRLCSVAPFIEKVRADLEPGWRLLLKPHPYALRNSDIVRLYAAMPGSLVVQDNIYALLCAPAVRKVITLSSSVAEEARLFGKTVRQLLRPDRDVTVPIMNAARITGTSLTAILRQRLSLRFSSSPVFLRNAVRQDWGYRPQTGLCRRTISAGQSLCFEEAGAGVDLCTLGWGLPERGGLWSEGPFALMLLQPQAPGLTLALDFVPFVPLGHSGVGLTIRCGSGRNISVKFRKWEVQRILVELPITPGPVQLEFLIEGATSPATHGLSDDRRLLGVQLRQATITSRAALSTRTRRAALRTAQFMANLVLLGLGLEG